MGNIYSVQELAMATGISWSNKANSDTLQILECLPKAGSPYRIMVIRYGSGTSGSENYNTEGAEGNTENTEVTLCALCVPPVPSASN
jgi:hypothetical protein